MGRKLERASAELARAQRTAVERAALAMTTDIRQVIERDSGDSRLSGVGKKGAKVGAGFDVKGTRNPVAIIRARGPLHLLANRTKPHTIEPKARRRRGGNRVGLGMPDGQVRASVQHPGTRGKDTWRRGVAVGLPKAVRILRSSTVDAVRRGLRA